MSVNDKDVEDMKELGSVSCGAYDDNGIPVEIFPSEDMLNKYGSLERIIKKVVRNDGFIICYYRPIEKVDQNVSCIT